jgi:HK97 family phage major capsid protein
LEQGVRRAHPARDAFKAELQGVSLTAPGGITITAGGYTLTAPSATITAPTITGIPLVPKVVIVELEFSHLLWKLAPALLDSYVLRELGRTLGVGVDAAVISGSGGDGDPLGVINVDGIGSTSGTGFGNAAAAEMLRKTAAGTGADASTAWLAAPAVRELLQKRERVADTGVFVWDDDKILNRPAYAPSVGVPADSVVLADWARIVLGLWGNGIELTVTPFASSGNFQAGIVTAQARLTCDVAALSPAAICVASSIT